MADPILHIKDSYFFELPKVLYPIEYRSRKQFPDVWIRNDPEFQDWEFHRQYGELVRLKAGLPAENIAHDDWQAWVHADHARHAMPFDEFLEAKYHEHLAAFRSWRQAQIAAAEGAKERDPAALAAARAKTLKDYLATSEVIDKPYAKFSGLRDTPQFQGEWAAAQRWAGRISQPTDSYNSSDAPEWSKDKIEVYNHHLSGKLIIPQPFGELRNLHEAQSTLISQDTGWINYHNLGFCISKFMVIEVVVGLLLVLVFSWLGRKLLSGGAPRGKSWNFFEVFFVFIRDEIARPSLDGHHGHEEHGHAEHDAHGHEAAVAAPSHGHEVPAHDSHAHAAPAHHARPSDKYTPVLCTIFFFILGCNLAGMLPWVGSPTGTWAVTLAMAMITLLAGFVGGVAQFGLAGYFLNQIPSMDLPWYMALVLKPFLFVIELFGLMIKHAVLSVRLLANMLAGHMVLLAIMGISFGATAAAGFVAADGTISPWWWVASIASVIGCTLLSLLELFVAFLQAYVFTLLSALFIGAAIHKH
ncbi:MAG: F0F1 ATP synthase subunit A [Pirellulaceae bacterium]|nr:F0F1 ATP synthase subunit A [Pirellulaceae bacterium]